MPSITTWSRIEPQTSGADATSGVDVGYAARVHDPLWLLGRQWQWGSSRARTPVRRSWPAGVLASRR
jgi:hypothetical protein